MGVGLRLRLNCFNDKDFNDAVNQYSKAFAVSCHNYQRAKSELMKSKTINREAYLKGEIPPKNRRKGKSV